MTHQDPQARLREIAAALPHLVYPHPDWDQVHALEDEAATLLGKRTVRQAQDVVSSCELYRLLQAAISAPLMVNENPRVRRLPGLPEELLDRIIDRENGFHWGG